jgi:hypothetical protein
MFSTEQKRNIANAVQQILRDTGHPELPVTEIKFMLHVHSRFQWSWADIQNNNAVPIPSVNPWNEAQDKATPPEPQHGREPEKSKGCSKACDDCSKHPFCIFRTSKSLAQYLAEYIEHEQTNNEENCGFIHGIDVDFQGQSISVCIWELKAMLQQALNAYESTEGVKIRIERV